MMFLKVGSLDISVGGGGGSDMRRLFLGRDEVGVVGSGDDVDCSISFSAAISASSRSSMIWAFRWSGSGYS